MALFCLGVLINISSYSQTAFFDYTDGKEFCFYGTTYCVANPAEQLLQRIYEMNKSLYVGLGAVENEQFQQCGQYVDGSFVEDPDETYGIIKYAPNDRKILYHAMRNVFTLEELEANPETMLVVHFSVDSQGDILETSVGFPIRRDYVIQPQQIAALQIMIRKNLHFVLNEERASRFNYFQGEIWLFFRDFIQEPTLPEGVESLGEIGQISAPLYTIQLVEDFNYFGTIEGRGEPPTFDRINGLKP